MDGLPVLIMFGLICFLLLAGLIRMQRRERWSLLRGLLAAVGIRLPVRQVSTVSEVEIRDDTPTSTVQPDPIAASIMSHTQRRAIQRRQIAGVRRAYTRVKLENRKLETENSKLRQQLDEATKGQRKAIRVYLEKTAERKFLTRSDVAALLGRDKGTGLQLIAHVDGELEQERRLAAPLPPEIAKPEALPV